MINSTLLRRARNETCLASLTFSQFLSGRVFADFSPCAKSARFSKLPGKSATSRRFCARGNKAAKRRHRHNSWKTTNVYSQYSDEWKENTEMKHHASLMKEEKLHAVAMSRKEVGQSFSAFEGHVFSNSNFPIQVSFIISKVNPFRTLQSKEIISSRIIWKESFSRPRKTTQIIQFQAETHSQWEQAKKTKNFYCSVYKISFCFFIYVSWPRRSFHSFEDQQGPQK